MKKKRFLQAVVTLFLVLILLPAGAGAGEICLESINNSDTYYRLNYVQLESVYTVSGFLEDSGNTTRLATTGTAFRQLDRSLVISLSTTYPNFYTHPRCTGILTFEPGKFLTATREGTCFGSTTSPIFQYTDHYVRVSCPQG